LPQGPYLQEPPIGSAQNRAPSSVSRQSCNSRTSVSNELKNLSKRGEENNDRTQRVMTGTDDFLPWSDKKESRGCRLSPA
jgi:hypothetical protein